MLASEGECDKLVGMAGSVSSFLSSVAIAAQAAINPCPANSSHPVQAMTGKLLGVAQELISSRERVAPAESKPRANTAPEVVSR